MASTPPDSSRRVLDILDLQVHFDTPDGEIHAVRGVNCHIVPGECLGIVGESGSGKSQTFLAAMGLLAPNGRAHGRIEFHGQNLLDMTLNQLNAVRGDRVSMIFQDPLTSLTPHLRVGEQMREVLSVHKNLSGAAADTRCVEWLDRVHIPDARQRLRQFPHELSGGMRQRVMIAMAMLCTPELLIADEPTTALDVTIQAEILDLMDELRRDEGTAIALITHDMGVVARMCDRVQVMRLGEYVETGQADTLFSAPEHEYTRMLLDAVPRIPVFTTASSNTGPSMRASAQPEPSRADGTHTTPPDKSRQEPRPKLQVEDLRVHFRVPNGWFRPTRTLRAVDGVSLELAAGETLGIVGESGSGKSTLARAILQLIPAGGGRVSWLGTSLDTLSHDELKAHRRDLQIVFQDPLASLDPSMTVGDSIAEPLQVFEPRSTRQTRTLQVADIMQRVGLEHSLINRYPHELSGGQNQRVGIARAMISKPQLLVCDEAVSALDVSIQAQILDLLRDLQAEFGLSMLFISHDLSVVWDISHRILVMYLGQVVELASREQLFRNPQHPYTRQLISAVPIADPVRERDRKRLRLKGALASPMDPDAQLRFLPSRRQSNTFGQSANDPYRPKLLEASPGHWVAEHDPLDSLLSDVPERV